MKFLFLFLFLHSLLFSSTIFTLDKVQNFKMRIINSADFLTKNEEQDIKTFIQIKLSKAGFIFDEIDPIMLFVKIKSLEVSDELYVINVQLFLAEDVKTRRGIDVQTFAYTYFKSTMMESEDPYEDTMEAINYLTCQLITAYKEDNE